MTARECFAAQEGARARANKVGILKPRDDLEKPLDVSSILQTMSNNGGSHFLTRDELGIHRTVAS